MFPPFSQLASGKVWFSFSSCSLHAGVSAKRSELLFVLATQELKRRNDEKNIRVCHGYFPIEEHNRYTELYTYGTMAMAWHPQFLLLRHWASTRSESSQRTEEKLKARHTGDFSVDFCCDFVAISRQFQIARVNYWRIRGDLNRQ